MEDKHIALTIGCSNKGGHAAFHIEDGKFICDNCQEDFTNEVNELVENIMYSLKKD